jgi:hypothetical protein
MKAEADIVDPGNAQATLPVFFRHYIPRKPISDFARLRSIFYNTRLP